MVMWIFSFNISNRDLRIWLQVGLFSAFTFAFMIMVGVVIGVIRLNEIIFNSSLQVRNLIHYFVYFINFLTLVFILSLFLMFISKAGFDAKEESCGLNAMLIITTFGILGMT